MSASAFVGAKAKDTKKVLAIYFSEEQTTWTEKDVKKVLSFVKNGGGLFLATTPWGWAQIKGSNDFNLMLTYKTLL